MLRAGRGSAEMDSSVRVSSLCRSGELEVDCRIILVVALDLLNEGRKMSALIEKEVGVGVGSG